MEEEALGANAPLSCKQCVLTACPLLVVRQAFAELNHAIDSNHIDLFFQSLTNERIGLDDVDEAGAEEYHTALKIAKAQKGEDVLLADPLAFVF